MKIKYDLNLNQSQNIIMTPKLSQAIQLLQLNIVGLDEYIKEQLEENLMLDLEEDIEVKKSLEDEIEKKEINWEKYINNNIYDEYIVKNVEDKNSYESFIEYKPTMNEKLIKQLRFNCKNDVEIEIGMTLIQNLDENGYLKVDLNLISDKLDIGLIHIEKVLKKIQNLEPLGIGARSLEECLMLQVDDGFEDAVLVKKIISKHLEDIAYNRIDKIYKSLMVDEIRIINSIDYIKTLEPRPAKRLSDKNKEIYYIIPDAEIKLIDGKFKVFVKESLGPRLVINNGYKKMMKSSSDKNAVEYLNDRFNKAKWVIRSIEERKQTIKKVIESILKFQEEFFIYGERSLIPLTLKEVAEDIKMHESTVSRVTTNKYVQTPRGLFELKYFFSSSITSIDGDISSNSIKYLIKDIIEEEDINNPYSDQKITNILVSKGIKISRRTVSKYRNELDILSSSMRRRF